MIITLERTHRVIEISHYKDIGNDDKGVTYNNNSGRFICNANFRSVRASFDGLIINEK